MIPKWIPVLANLAGIAVVLCAPLAHAQSPNASGGSCPAAGDAALTRLLTPIREGYRVPALAAAVVTSKGLVTAGAVGTRKRGTEVAVSLNDHWHLGSDAKAMNYANVWVAPQRDFATLVCINQSGHAAFLASDEAASALVKLRSASTSVNTPSRRLLLIRGFLNGLLIALRCRPTPPTTRGTTG